jgi:ADP-ribosylglycohydrolase
VSWQRRIGGRSGIDVELPEGCYSDDTQLRLAVGRSIRAHGFDPETFAKVELPVWTNYALGGGRASKAAAANIVSQSVPWFANFFSGWPWAGGNGAAMRIQPHIWAASTPASIGPHIRDIVIDSAVTHGHPRALVGAIYHGLTLGYILQYGEIPEPAVWADILKDAHEAYISLAEHPELSGIWLAQWNRETGEDFQLTWDAATVEVDRMLSVGAKYAMSPLGSDQQQKVSFNQLINDLDLREEKSRGSGTKTVVAALAIAKAYAARPADGLRMAARAIGTDTDTIATMAGALLGAQADNSPPTEVLDADYISREADRLARLACDEANADDGFRYPDLLYWNPPRTQADAVRSVDGELELLGFGILKDVDTVGESRGFAWSWATLPFGQKVIVKRRNSPVTHHNDDTEEALPILDQHMMANKDSGTGATTTRRHAHPQHTTSYETRLYNAPDSRRNLLETQEPTSAHLHDSHSDLLNVDEILSWAKKQGLTNNAIGYAVRRLAEKGSMEQLIAFITAVRSDIKKHES